MTTTDASTLIGNLSIYAETVTVGTHTVEVEGVINQDSMVFRPVQVASETYPLISYSKGAGMENKVDEAVFKWRSRLLRTATNSTDQGKVSDLACRRPCEISLG